MKRMFPPSFYNLTTLLGAGLALLSFGLILFLTLVELFTTEQKPYMGIITFVILPAFLMLGLLLLIFGWIRESRRVRKGKPQGMRLPVVDMNNPSHRKAFVYFSFGTVLLLMFTAFGSFKAYEYTDSDEFCGTMCHEVMHPEYTAYQYSPHAKVGCVKCHIGPGTGWFVRSKLSGAYQVYATVLKIYPKPIPTPIQNLRPAQETCEQCHWPKHFFSEKQRQFTYFMQDENNTKWTLNLLMKIGGGNVDEGPTSGIHWHMNIKNEVTYAMADSSRQTIPWIKSRTKDGKETIYRSTEDDYTDAQIGAMAKRKMDCIDCHNRPTHIYHPSGRSVNTAMAIGWVDRALPNIKTVAVSALDNPYTTQKRGMDSNGIRIENYYREKYPAVYASSKGSIRSSVKQLQKVFSRNYFPEMKVDWRRFTDNIGHMYYKGCFRCHDGKHQTKEGKVLTNDCNVCHTILAQQYEKDTLRISLGGVEYQHPGDIGDAWKEMQCVDCHTAE